MNVFIVKKPNHKVSPVANFCTFPKPSDSFISNYIEEYNKSNIITDVLVEVNITKSINKDLFPDIVKVNTDNTINIIPNKPKLYTTDEVSKLLEDLNKQINKTSGELALGNASLNIWILNNLK